VHVLLLCRTIINNTSGLRENSAWRQITCGSKLAGLADLPRARLGRERPRLSFQAVNFLYPGLLASRRRRAVRCRLVTDGFLRHVGTRLRNSWQKPHQEFLRATNPLGPRIG